MEVLNRILVDTIEMQVWFLVEHLVDTPLVQAE
jgi:hypothetical protein